MHGGTRYLVTAVEERLKWDYLLKWIAHFDMEELWEAVKVKANFTPPV
ncbi:MAG: hypothetical protein QGG53_17870 [Planctomycetota bacterium]|jgi:hypothetical protein|nr:hypothetical protein [Planctomycetota bacterium]